jgi:uncharacterized alpha-E superfamily protein
MSRLDAKYCREKAKRCRKAAAKARDRVTKERWLEGERCWTTLANQVELVAELNASPK